MGDRERGTSGEVRSDLRGKGGVLGDTRHQPRRAAWERIEPHNTYYIHNEAS